MKKQTTRNNSFLKEIKQNVTNDYYEILSDVVNNGKQDVAEYMYKTNLYFYHNAELAAEKLLKIGHPANPAHTPEEIDALYDLVGVNSNFFK